MKNVSVDNYLANSPKPFSKKILVKKQIWVLVWRLCISWLPKAGANGWIRFVYRAFGAKIPHESIIHPTARIYMPWNLEMGFYSVIGSNVKVLNAAPLIIGDNCAVSERAFLCGASHNIYSDLHEQTNAPIVLKDRSWVAAEAFVGMGVTIGEGAVVGARAVVFKNVAPWTVMGGNPAVVIKKRDIKR